LNELKGIYKSGLPVLQWQFILMEHNEQDVIKAKEMAKELNMKINFKLTWDPGYKPLNPEILKRETGMEILSREEYIRINKRPFIYYICYMLWNTPVIGWDGKLFGCCEAKYDFGINVFKVGLRKALKNKRLSYAKRMLLGKAPSPSDIRNNPCATCYCYKEFLKQKIFITEAEIHL
jgi:hypothetical protein